MADREPDGAADSGASAGDESTGTVLLALAANAGVALLKLIAGLLSGSAAMLSEAAHSIGDTSTEVLLLTALRRSSRAADRRHPFGYGKERYFWSLLAAVGIFVSGAIFSTYEGIHAITAGADLQKVWVNYAVLAGSALLEGASLRQAIRQARGGAQRSRRSITDYIRDPEDPTVKSVVLEDSVAIVGLILAAAGVALHEITGNAVYDGAASIAIGLLLVVASILLAQTCKGLLIGRQADPRLLRTIEQRLEAQPEVDDVVDLLTMLLGTGNVLLCARVDFVDTYSAAELELACVRIEASLRSEFHILGEIFLEPVPRSDRAIRERVLQRYGRVIADEPPSDGRGTPSTR